MALGCGAARSPSTCPLPVDRRTQFVIPRNAESGSISPGLVSLKSSLCLLGSFRFCFRVALVSHLLSIMYHFVFDLHDELQRQNSCTADATKQKIKKITDACNFSVDVSVIISLILLDYTIIFSVFPQRVN